MRFWGRGAEGLGRAACLQASLTPSRLGCVPVLVVDALSAIAAASRSVTIFVFTDVSCDAWLRRPHQRARQRLHPVAPRASGWAHVGEIRVQAR